MLCFCAQLDKERAAYNLKEGALSDVICLALNLDKHSEMRTRIKNWKMSSKGLDFAVICGNVAGEFVGRRNKKKSGGETGTTTGGGMTIDEVNEMLDKMCMGNDREAKARELRKFIMRATEKEVVWIVSIILKDLKLGGVSEKDFLMHYHPQAYEAYTCKADLRKACEALSDRNAVLKKHDIECGEGVIIAQLAGRKNTPKEVAKWARSKAFAVETKFDGERVQIHRNKESLGEKCQYWTRNMNDFGPRGYGIMDVLFCDAAEEEGIRDTVDEHRRGLPPKCILDGEILVYNKRIKEFVPFGTIKRAFNAANWKKNMGKNMPIIPKGFYENPTMQTKEKGQAKDKEEDDDEEGEEEKEGNEDEEEEEEEEEGEEGRVRYEWKDFEIVYVPFDILYNEDTSVIHEPLRKRYELLKGAIRGCLNKGAVKVGDTGITCAVVSPFQDDIADNESQAEIARKFRTVVEQNDPNAIAKISDCLREAQDHGEEGIVVKLLDSPWVPGERGHNWVKLKPDYCETSDYDCVIIGGYYGEGRGRAGKISQWLLGVIKDGTQRDKNPTIMTFCKVGTGFNREDQHYLRDKLKDLMRFNRKNVDKNYTKTCERYECSGMLGETPDVWITKPEKSVVMAVKGDVRLVPSHTFNAPYGLRFPRCSAIRPEKPWNEICTDKDIAETAERYVNKVTHKGSCGGDGVGNGEQGEDERTAYKEYDRKNAKGLKRKQKRSLAVQEKYVAHMQPVDVRNVVTISKIFEGTAFSAIGCDRDVKKEIAEFVVARGGKFFESVVGNVNRVVAPPTIEVDDAYLQACDEVLSTNWLFSCKEQEIWPPKARDWIKVSPSVATLYDKTIDAFGDAHMSEDLNDEDFRAMRHQVCSRKRKGTEFKTLRHIDDDDRQNLGKIVRLSEESNTVILSQNSRPKKDLDPAIKEDDEREADRKRKKQDSSAHMQALELIQRRKAAAEMLRIY